MSPRGPRRIFRLPIRRRDLTERDVDDEARLHVELRAEQLEREGLSPEAALAEAWRRFDPEGTASLRPAARRRDRRLDLAEWVSGVRRDLVQAVRTCRHRRLYCLGVTGTLALGIGAGTLAAALAWNVWLAPMPFPDPEGVVRLYEVEPPDLSGDPTPREVRRQLLSAGLLKDFRELRWSTVATFSAVLREGEIPWVRDGSSDVLSRTGLSPEGFAILGVERVLGRHPVRHGEVLLDEGFWERGFGSDPDVVGSTMTLGARSFEVVGVGRLPAGYPGRSDVVLALREGEGDRGFRNTEVIARLRPGRTPAEARAEAEAFLAAVAEAHPEHRGWGVDVVVLSDDLIRPFEEVVALLYLAGMVVLLLTGVNVTVLVSARRLERRGDRSIRLALGASEGRLLRASVLENVLLASSAAVGGLGAAYVLAGPVRGLLPADIPRLDRVAVTPELALVGLGLGVALGILIGVAGHFASRHAGPALGRALAWTRGDTPGRRTFVVVQLALIALILSGGAAVLHRVSSTWAVDLGFDPERVSVASAVLEQEDRWRVVSEVLEGLETRGVRSAAALNEPLTEEDVPQMAMRRDDASEETVYEMHLVSADYFPVMGIEVLVGNVFDDRGPTAARPEVVVSESFVRSYFPEGTSVEDAVGRVLAPLPYESTGPVVAGVVASTRHHGPDAPVTPEIYVPLSHLTLGVVSILAEGEPEQVAGALRSVSARVEPGFRWTDPVAYASRLGTWYGPLRVQLFTVAMLSGIGLLMAVLGIYSFVGYEVVRRSHELAVRKALGAPDSRLVTQVLASVVALSTAGSLLGLAGWYLLAPRARRLLGGLDPAGAVVPLAVLTLVGTVCLLAALGPVLRITRVDPAETLKVEA